MTLAVTDSRSNKNDQIKHVVEVLGRSKDRLKVFKAIYQGKKAVKTVSDIMRRTGLSRVRVNQEAGKLSGNGIIQAFRVGRETSYKKDLFYSTNRSTILRLVGNPKGLQRLPTKTQPRQSGGSTVIIKGVERKPRIKEVHIDDIDSFEAVRKVGVIGIQNSHLSEKRFKRGVQKLLGEPGKFSDWGGEKGDLLTSRLRYKGKRIPTVFAFKGPGTRGTLTPKKMGKNGDQVQRLFESSASFFILQYWAEIGERVREQAEGWATLTSMRMQKKILFCLIDGKDTSRLIQAYPRQFS
ncbi:MAG: winged helix-turn-helix domain-containing protein [Candidatus Acidiferrales bacterium]